jgi:predicted GNAT family N-acyltransferase
VSSSATCTTKSQEQDRLVRTRVGRLAAATVGRGSRLGRKNMAKAGKKNGTSDDDENDGACERELDLHLFS